MSEPDLAMTWARRVGAGLVLGWMAVLTALPAASTTPPKSGAASTTATTKPKTTTTKPAAPAAKPATASKSAPAASPKELLDMAAEVRQLEESGAYGLAADRLRALRVRVPADADLDLALALNLARSGAPDSAARILEGPTLKAALTDTADTTRYRIYSWSHERKYFGGKFEGWHWYVARARVEVASRRGQWSDALDAARICTRARPLAGVEWYLRALCAARTGAADEAEASIERALKLDPTIPEAQYLKGVLVWRALRRAEAQERFRTAIALDSTYREPAVALSRVRLPVPPDTLPSRLLGGLREASLLTSRMRPKYDEFDQMDISTTLVQGSEVTLPESLRGAVKPYGARTLGLVDTRGRIVFHEDPWKKDGSVPDDIVGLISEALRQRQLTPAIRHGRPQPLWLLMEVPVKE